MSSIENGLVLPDDLPKDATILEIPEHHPVRRKIDEAISFLSSAEKKYPQRETYPYVLNRTGVEYLARTTGLAGLEYFFGYVSSLQGSGRVLDIGAGTTRGAHDLSLFVKPMGLDVEATVLTDPPQQPLTLPPDKVHLTSAEYLEGVNDESVDGIIAFSSIMYSVSPELTIRRINQVLPPGGALKATFNPHNRDIFIEGRPEELIGRNSDAFVGELERLGYDVALDKRFDYGFDVLLAIKPGNEDQKSASQILEADAEHYENQQAEMRNTLDAV